MTKTLGDVAEIGGIPVQFDCEQDLHLRPEEAPMGHVCQFVAVVHREVNIPPPYPVVAVRHHGWHHLPYTLDRFALIKGIVVLQSWKQNGIQ